MNKYSQIYTKATSFVGSIQGDVDPRTGQFTINISLGSLKANNGLGPEVPLTLSYSPMDQTNFGFGVGFGFGFTTYDQRSTLLYLSNGSQYKVLESVGSLSLIDAKLKEVSISKVSQNYYKVIYRDGRFEILTAPDVMSSQKFPCKIVTANGHYITLNWAFVDNHYRLKSIIDENETKLVEIRYPNSSNFCTQIAVLPDRQEVTKASECPEGYNVNFFFGQNQFLTKITCDAAEGLEWDINYTNLNSIGPWGLIASGITHPGGLCESATYSRFAGHRFGRARYDMVSNLYPYVTELTRNMGRGQPVIKRSYQYELINQNNFLGYAAPGVFARNPTLDALNNCTDSTYRYHTREIHIDSDSVETRIERSYNCFHQLTEKKTTKQNCSVTAINDYYSVPGAGFAAQSGNFQCLKQKTVISRRTNPETGETVSENQAVAMFEYDDYGNITKKSGTYTDINGITTTAGTILYAYYPADTATSYGSDTGYGCPAVPNSYNRSHKIPRFLKSETFIPHSFLGDEKSKQKRYSYAPFAFPDAVTNLLEPSDADLPTSYTVFKTEERNYSNTENSNVLLQKVKYTYAENTVFLKGSAKPMSEFGSLLMTVNTHYPNDGLQSDGSDPKTTGSFDTIKQVSRALNDDVLEITTMDKTWDDLSILVSEKQSRYTNRVTESIDALGVKDQTTYDVLGRTVSLTTAVDTQYAGTQSFNYGISSSGWVSTAIDSLNNQARVTADGAGRPVKGEVKLCGQSSVWQVMETKDYDNSGYLQSITLYDYLESSDLKPFSVATSINHFDNWGRVDYVTTCDGIKHYRIIDPIEASQTTFSVSGGPDTVFTSRTVLSVVPDKATVKAEVFAAGNLTSTPDSTTVQVYDGWKQLRKTTDELGRSTVYDYDNFGRIVKTTLPTVTVPGNGQTNISITNPANGQTVPSLSDPGDPYCYLSFSGTASPGTALYLCVDGEQSPHKTDVTSAGDWSSSLWVDVSIPYEVHTFTATNSNDEDDKATIKFYTKNDFFSNLDRLLYEGADPKPHTLSILDRGNKKNRNIKSETTVVTKAYNISSPSNSIADIRVNDLSMGTREFDGMDRVTRQTVGGRSWSATYNVAHGSLTEPATITSPFLTPIIDFQYEPALGGAVLNKTANQDKAVFTYNNKGQLEKAINSVVSFEPDVAFITCNYDGVGRLLSENFSQHGGTVLYCYTTTGKPKSYTDVTGITWRLTYDQFGRVTNAVDDDVSLSLKYDALSRLSRWVATDNSTNSTLTTTLSWDALGHERSRLVESSANQSGWLLEQDYNLNHQLKQKILKRNINGSYISVRTEKYSYDERNRMIKYTCDGSELIKDEKGKCVTSQSFVYDIYNNIRQCVTTFDTEDQDTATYCYANPNDPCQLSSVVHANKDYPAELYDYDAAGNLKVDAAGRQFTYDTGIHLGYLRSVEKEDNSRILFYDPANRIIKEGESTLVYRGSELVNQFEGNDASRFVGGQLGTFAQVRKGQNAGVWLCGFEANGSVLSMDNASAGTRPYNITYSPYGESEFEQSIPSAIGYTGQRKSISLDGYHLGNGYRLYQPSLRRFISPDSASPFGDGGINAYAYCAGDPINNVDPTGHTIFLLAIAIVGILFPEVDGAEEAVDLAEIFYSASEDSGTEGYYSSHESITGDKEATESSTSEGNPGGSGEAEEKTTKKKKNRRRNKNKNNDDATFTQVTGRQHGPSQPSTSGPERAGHIDSRARRILIDRRPQNVNSPMVGDVYHFQQNAVESLMNEDIMNRQGHDSRNGRYYVVREVQTNNNGGIRRIILDGLTSVRSGTDIGPGQTVYGVTENAWSTRFPLNSGITMSLWGQLSGNITYTGFFNE